uniref:Uncharacterized protein n=1 Tax=Anguilla anguilla TaxID=7936 RepID=A0A0E9PI25_ANGAN
MTFQPYKLKHAKLLGACNF